MKKELATLIKQICILCSLTFIISYSDTIYAYDPTIEFNEEGLVHEYSTIEGFWDPTGQYHPLPKVDRWIPAEEAFNKKVEIMQQVWSEEAVQRHIAEWRKDYRLDPETSTSETSSPYSKEQIEAAWEETGRIEATCGADGSISYKNSLTGNTKTEKIPATGLHTFEVTEHVDATCIAEGHETSTCSECGETQTVSIPSTGNEHTYELKEKVNPTCTEDGYETYTCSICEDAYTSPIPALNHQASTPAVSIKAGLFNNGERIVKCTKCGAILSAEVIPQKCPLSIYQIIFLFAIIFVMIFVVIRIIKTESSKNHINIKESIIAKIRNAKQSTG